MTTKELGLQNDCVKSGKPTGPAQEIADADCGLKFCELRGLFGEEVQTKHTHEWGQRVGNTPQLHTVLYPGFVVVRLTIPGRLVHLVPPPYIEFKESLIVGPPLHIGRHFP